MSSDELISREEALTGLPAKRANTLLFLIENRTAHLAARSLVDFSLSEATAAERDLAFLEAFAFNQAPPLRPTIQHLERYAPQWTDLIPKNPSTRAALARAFGQKYRFTPSKIPKIQAALGLTEQKVKQAYSRLYQTSLADIYAVQLSLKEQLGWLVTAISIAVESLPPFWLASLITVALGLPQAFLALPIAAAGIGAVSSLALIIAIGSINILTMACMAEAISRSGDFRYGNALLKQLTANYLGSGGSLILTAAVGIRVFLIALACYVGLAATMADLTPIPASIWAALLFLAGLYLLSQQSLKFTLGIMVLLAAVNISLLLGLSLLAFTHLEIANLFYFNLPFVEGGSFQPQLVQQVFGVSLMLYFGHVYVGECAKLILPKDNSAGSLIKGSIAGTVILTILFCIWILAVNGAIAPSLLATQSGTVLEPLAQQIGFTVKIIGSILVVFLLGMAWVRSSSLLFNLTQEWIPNRHQPTLILTSRRGRLILQPRFGSFPRLGISYLGLEGERGRFRLDIQSNCNLHHADITVTDNWNIEELFERFPEIRRLKLKLAVRSLTKERAYVRVSSPMILSYEGKLETTDTNNTSVRDRPQATWISLMFERRFILSSVPLAVVFLLAEWLFFANTQSFTSVLAFAGVLGNSLVGGIFPILLLIASRHKGELVPEVVIKKLDRPFVLAGIYIIFLGILLVHGLFIWEGAIAKLAALMAACLALGATLITIYAGALTTRTVIELCEETNSRKTFFNVTAKGKPQSANISLCYGDREQQYQDSSVEVDSLSLLRYAICQLPTRGKEELKIWTHRRNISGNYESLPTLLEVYRGDKKMQFDLRLSGGKVLLPALGAGARSAIAGNCWLKFRFSSSS